MTVRKSGVCDKCGKTVTWSPKRESPMHRHSVFGVICWKCFCEDGQKKAAEAEAEAEAAEAGPAPLPLHLKRDHGIMWVPEDRQRKGNQR